MPRVKPTGEYRGYEDNQPTDTDRAGRRLRIAHETKSASRIILCLSGGRVSIAKVVFTGPNRLR